MEYIFIFILLVIVCILIYTNNNKKTEIRNIKEEKIESIKNELQSQAQDRISNLNNQINNLNSRISVLQNDINSKTQFNDSLRKMREDELDRLIESRKEQKENELAKEIEEWAQSAQEAASNNAMIQQLSLLDAINSKKQTLESLNSEIIDFQKKREIINQDILRARAVEENQNFYRVNLDDATIHDINLIEETRKHLIKTDLLDKLIYDNYIKRPVDEMIKRVLSGRAPSGIYKITRLKTGEVYIGKSVDIKSRWQNHSKTAFHCGTVSFSTLHTTIQMDGIQNFTWELLEEVPKDNLSDREKFWIDFYGSKEYGLNQKAGG